MEIINWKELLYPYAQTVDELLLKFRSLDKECRQLGIYSPIDSVTGRLKRPASILEKAGRKQISPDRIEEEIEDIAGIRILCQFVEDIPKVIEMVRKRKDMTVIEERDYITNTKPSGYRSYHMLVTTPVFLSDSIIDTKVEIQIRTVAQDFWATLEHKMHYKFEGDGPDYITKELRECARYVAELDTRMEELNNEIQKYGKLSDKK